MSRRLFAGLLGVAVAAAAGLPTAAQEKKKEQPKKERVAVADPGKAKADPDFLTQGEYVGGAGSGNKTSPLGAQVVAKGKGEFDVKVYAGGLPGAGWDGKTVMKGTARRDGDRVAVTGKDVSGGDFTAALADGKFALKTLAGEGTLGRVGRKSPTLGARPPAGAVVLFGGPGDEKNWTNGKLMELSDGTFLTVSGTRGLKSKQAFGAFKAHIEFRTPWMPASTGQGRGNSGVFLQDRYEVQVLDSFGLRGENNECGGIYTQHKPLVNMCLPPLTWQTYDIEFTPAEFDAAGKKSKNARTTLLHNGVKIHDNVEHPKECPAGQKEDAKPGPFQLQDHGDPVVYNNIWVVEVK